MKAQQLGGLNDSTAVMKAGCIANLGGECVTASGTEGCLKLSLPMQQSMIRIALHGASNLAGQCSPSAHSTGVLSEIAPSVVMTPVIVSRVLLHLNMMVTATALPTWEVSAHTVQLEGCLTFIMCLLWPYVIVLQLHCPHVIVLWLQQPSITEYCGYNGLMC